MRGRLLSSIVVAAGLLSAPAVAAAILVSTITSGPANRSTINHSTATFTFSSSEVGSTFECRFNGGAFTACSSPYTTIKLGDGTFSFAVRAVDGAGNRSANVRRTFTVDTKPPQTTIARRPRSKTTDRRPRIRFSSSAAGSTFKCRLDRKPRRPCASPLRTRRLSFGRHTFTVVATDPAGNVDPTPAKAAFKVVRRHR